MNLQTYIEIYNPETSMYVGEINIDHLGLEHIQAIVPPKADDPGYYNPLPITKEQFNVMKDKVEELRKYKFEDDAFFIQTRGLKE